MGGCRGPPRGLFKVKGGQGPRRAGQRLCHQGQRQGQLGAWGAQKGRVLAPCAHRGTPEGQVGAALRVAQAVAGGRWGMGG